MLIEEIILNEFQVQNYVNALKDHNVLLVKLYAPDQVVQERESKRQHPQQLGLRHSNQIHKYLEYDMAIDTSKTSVQENAHQIFEKLKFHKDTKDKAMDKLIKKYVKPTDKKSPSSTSKKTVSQVASAA